MSQASESNITIIRGGEQKTSVWAIPQAIIKNRGLVLSLGKNDFKQKFAGSYLGVVWAFVQPIVTVLVYWFVFELALNAGTQSTKAGIEAPYVLWLLAGIVPWFFFQDAVNSASNALVEYDYLVKKVVFQISILPVVKLFSAFFVHVFFVAFTLILYACYGFTPTVYTLQLIYYFLAMTLFTTGLVYLTSALVALFRDMKQVITIILSVLIWMTPIMWNMDAMAARLPHAIILILQLNPLYYIVQGYRDSLLNQVWFFEHPTMTIYFWVVTLLFFLIGTKSFQKLQVHFADIL